MGSDLWRKIASFECLISPDSIAAVKHETNEIETALSSDANRRRANVDPGYLSAHHLVLATTKISPHRPYLCRGIYADLTLIYQEGAFRSLPWTYPDYGSDTMTAIMNVLRQKYLFQSRREPSDRSGN
jgi:hypothetical protein